MTSFTTTPSGDLPADARAPDACAPDAATAAAPKSQDNAPARNYAGSAVVFENVRHSYNERVVINGVDLELVERRIGIIGPNGSGKSTLARMINGLVTPTGGRVTVNGLDVAHHGRAVRKKVGFIFTNPDNQIVMPTVAEDIAFSLRQSKLSKSAIADRVNAMLDRVGLATYADHPAHLLSEGQKQMLALAGVLIREPEVIVADEPTTLLDLGNAHRMTKALDELDQQIVMVTHNLDALAGFDRIILLGHGQVLADGAPEPTIRRYREMFA